MDRAVLLGNFLLSIASRWAASHSRRIERKCELCCCDHWQNGSCKVLTGTGSRMVCSWRMSWSRDGQRPGWYGRGKDIDCPCRVGMQEEIETGELWRSHIHFFCIPEPLVVVTGSRYRTCHYTVISRRTRRQVLQQKA